MPEARCSAAGPVVSGGVSVTPPQLALLVGEGHPLPFTKGGVSQVREKVARFTAG
jgi:hypothetical protein